MTCLQIHTEQSINRNPLTHNHHLSLDTAGTVRQVPKNARRREAKGGSSVQEHHHQPQLRNNNNANQQQHYRNNSERRSKWSKTSSSSSSSFAPGGEATGLATPEHSREDNDLDPDDIYLEQAEWDSVVVTGSKKHNLNHLLNFHYTPRDLPQPQRGGSAKQQGRAAKSVSSHYNKDQFLQAK